MGLDSSHMASVPPSPIHLPHPLLVVPRKQPICIEPATTGKTRRATLTDITQRTARKLRLDTISRRIHDEPPIGRTRALRVRAAAVAQRAARRAVVYRAESVSNLVRNQGPFGLQGGRDARARDIGGALSLGGRLADCAEPCDAYFAVLHVSALHCTGLYSKESVTLLLQRHVVAGQRNFQKGTG